MSETDTETDRTEIETGDGRFGFDPTQVGPLDLLALWNRRVGRFWEKNSRVLIGAAVALIIAAWHFGISFPEVPNWMLVGLLATLAAALPATWTGRRLAQALYKPNHELLSITNPVTGDQKLVFVAPERFDEMTVLNHNDKKRDRGFLHEIRVNGRKAWEVDSYNREQNVAVASWQAGVSSRAIRRDRSRYDYIIGALEEEADKSLELLANHPNILRKQAAEVSNRIIQTAEGVEVPDGGKLHERLSSMLEEADPSTDLLEGDDGDDSDEEAAPDDGTIHARAAQNGSSSGGEPADD